jgi:hypothetical protein
MVEGAVLIGLAVVAATALASWATTALAGTLPATMRAALANPIDLDTRALLFMSAVAATTWALTSLPVAWRASRGDVVELLKLDQRTMPVSRGDARIRQGLMAGQVALTVLLLVGALLYASTYRAQLSLDKGFDSANVVSFEVFRPRGSSIDAGALEADLLGRIGGYPGVTAISRTWAIPPSTLAGVIGGMRIDDETEPAATVKAAVYDVDPSFFETMGIPLLAGRGLVRGGPAGEAVVAAAYVRKVFPDTDPLGHRFAFGSSGANVPEIVGVARQVRGDLTRRLSAIRSS